MTVTSSTVDLRGLLSTPVLDQGARPTCLPVAVSQGHQAARGGLGLAPDALWDWLETSGSAGPDGTQPSDVAEALRLAGQPELLHWPLQSTPGCTVRPPGIDAQPWFTADLATGGRIDDLRDALDAGEIAIICVHVTDPFGYANAAAPVIDADPVLQAAYSGHAVICVGRRADASGQEQFLVRNSWGTAWADGGEGWLTAAFIQQHCYDVSRITSVHVPV